MMRLRGFSHGSCVGYSRLQKHYARRKVYASHFKKAHTNGSVAYPGIASLGFIRVFSVPRGVFEGATTTL